MTRIKPESLQVQFDKELQAILKIKEVITAMKKQIGGLKP